MPKITTKTVSPFVSNIAKPEDMISPEVLDWFSKLPNEIAYVRTYQETIDLASIAATSYSAQTFTVTGLTTNDSITVNPPALTAGLYFISARVSAADTVELTFYNSTGGAIDEASATYYIVAIRN